MSNVKTRPHYSLILQKDNRINNQTLNNFFLGNRKFISEMQKKFKVYNFRLKRGRPSNADKNIPSYWFTINFNVWKPLFPLFFILFLLNLWSQFYFYHPQRQLSFSHQLPCQPYKWCLLCRLYL